MITRGERRQMDWRRERQWVRVKYPRWKVYMDLQSFLLPLWEDLFGLYRIQDGTSGQSHPKHRSLLPGWLGQKLFLLTTFPFRGAPNAVLACCKGGEGPALNFWVCRHQSLNIYVFRSISYYLKHALLKQLRLKFLDKKVYHQWFTTIDSLFFGRHPSESLPVSYASNH